jgi:hypothetical protein
VAAPGHPRDSRIRVPALQLAQSPNRLGRGDDRDRSLSWLATQLSHIDVQDQILQIARNADGPRLVAVVALDLPGDGGDREGRKRAVAAKVEAQAPLVDLAPAGEKLAGRD